MQLIPQGANSFESNFSGIFIRKVIYLFNNKDYLMKILVVQESDWLERNPHQQHHLMERMALRGHEIKVIDYPIDWPKENKPGLVYKREIHKNISKIKENANIEVVRPSFVKIKGLNYATLFFSHKKEIERQIKEFKPDIILGLGILNTYNASKIAKKHGIPFVYYFIDVLHALIPEKAFQSMGKWFTQKTIQNATLVITINKKLSNLPSEWVQSQTGQY